MRNGDVFLSGLVPIEKTEDEMESGEEVPCPIVRVKTFGENNRALTVSCGVDFTVVKTDEGKVYAWGKTS